MVAALSPADHGPLPLLTVISGSASQLLLFHEPLFVFTSVVVSLAVAAVTL